MRDETVNGIRLSVIEARWWVITEAWEDHIILSTFVDIWKFP